MPPALTIANRQPRADDPAAELGTGLVPYAGIEEISADLVAVSGVDPIQSGSIYVEVNGVTLSHATSPIVDGYHVSASYVYGPGETFSVEMGADTVATSGSPEVFTWDVTTRGWEVPAGVVALGVAAHPEAFGGVVALGVIRANAPGFVRAEGASRLSGIFGAAFVSMQGTVLTAFDPLKFAGVRVFGRVAIERFIAALSAGAVVGDPYYNQTLHAGGESGNPEAIFAALAAAGTVGSEALYASLSAAGTVAYERIDPALLAAAIVGDPQFRSALAAAVLDGAAAEALILLTAESTASAAEDD